MKKLLAILCTIIMMTACAMPGAGLAEEKTLQIVTTIFPIYDWVREIAGPDAKVSITQLLDNGVDLHSFQPTAEDIRKTGEADLFLYVGGESDEWVEDVLLTISNPDWKSLNLVDALGDAVKAEELVEGMEHEHEEEEHDHEHEDEDHDHGEEADEHVWLSLRNAGVLTKAIAEMLSEIDPEHAETYQQNAAAYGEKLEALDQAYTEAVNQAAYKALLFADRFPFRYLADDYGLAYYAAFSGCSAESEASFATIIFLAQKLDELGLPAVMTIESSKTKKLAETVISSGKAKNQKILTLDSLQSMTSRDAEAGVTYLKVMEQNLEVLKEALN